ncbi:HEAT repeat domain-containing protein [Halorussus salinus]|uniref:HEAT repeat domain-containing protein n=1 Tax=Halorussus salinus TaxID=1364935 RepID=UPI00109208F9
MTDPDQSPSPDRLPDLLEAASYEEAASCLDRLGAAETATRKRALQSVRSVADERPNVLDGLAGPLAAFLADDDRAVRLTTAKLLLTVARAEPGVVRPVVASLADRLADDDEFYYVRARCAEALGYVALESPETVGDPDILADFRVGLSFDEPEVREKLAKALAFVALGNPGRLRHQVSSLADHLDDERELVRYHLCTSLVVVGCEHPRKLADADDALRERLADDSPYVRGRAAEALALVGESDAHVEAIPELAEIDAEDDELPSFATDRVRFARRVLAGDGQSVGVPDGVGTISSVRDGTEAVVEEMTAPDGDEECPTCGLALSDDGPPVCPRCGTPR